MLPLEGREGGLKGVLHLFRTTVGLISCEVTQLKKGESQQTILPGAFLKGKTDFKHHSSSWIFFFFLDPKCLDRVNKEQGPVDVFKDSDKLIS